MLKGSWEKMRGRPVLKFESHCENDFFKQTLPCLQTGSMRKLLLWVAGKFG